MFLFRVENGLKSDRAMARSLEELPRSLTGIRLGWSAVALLMSFVVALSVSSKSTVFCLV